MNAFFAILKCELLRLTGGTFNANKKNKNDKKSKAKIGVSIAVLALIALFAAGMSALYSFLFAMVLSETEVPVYSILGFFITFYLIIAFMFSLTAANGTVFGGKDYETVMSFPIRPIYVALAKSAYVYVFLLGLAVAIVLPSACVCSFFSKATVLTAFSIITGIIALPFLPMGLGLAIGSLVAILMARVKRKGIVRLIASALGVAVYFFFLFGITGDVEDEQIIAAFSSFSGALAPMCYIANGILNGGIAWLVAVFAPIAVSAIYYAFVAKYYKEINTLILAKRAGGNFKMKEQKQSSLLKCTLRREIKTWAATPGAVINQLMGPVLTLAMVVYLYVSGGVSSILEGFAEEESGIGASEFLFYFRGALPFIPVFFVSVSTYTSSAVSLEGKSVWIIKSLPLTYRDFLKPKLILGLLISLPLTAAAELLLGIAFGCRAFEIIAALAFLILYGITANAFGLYVNLKIPFLDWKNPAEAIKRGGAANVCAIIGMLIILPYGIIVALCIILLKSYYVAWAVNAAMTVAVLVAILLLFKKNGEKLYREL